MPGAGRAHSPVCENKKHTSKSLQVGRNAATFPAQRFTAYLRSPRRPGLLAAVACNIIACRLDPSVGGSGPRNFAVRIRRIRLAPSASIAARLAVGDDWPSAPHVESGWAG
jgi:hypothetical protein